jgi:hypothetical protein
MPAASTTRRTWWIVGLSLLLVASCLALTAGLGMLASGRLDRWLEQPHVAEIRVRGPFSRTLPRPAVITSVRRPTVSSPCLTPSPAVSG